MYPKKNFAQKSKMAAKFQNFKKHRIVRFDRAVNKELKQISFWNLYEIHIYTKTY